MSMSDYINKMKSLDDDMAAADQPLGPKELVGYILTRLDHEYNPMVLIVITYIEPITVSDLYNQLLTYEQRMDRQNSGIQSSANSASCGHGGGQGNQQGRTQN
jgi:hypothetical protein